MSSPVLASAASAGQSARHSGRGRGRERSVLRGRRLPVPGERAVDGDDRDDVTAPPSQVLAACRALRYRNHVGVNLVVEGRPFPDDWIYVHSKKVGMARIANYANFSPDMAARPGLNPLTVEYFCVRGDDVWDAPDHALVERAERELAK